MKPFLPTLLQAQTAIDMAGSTPIYFTNGEILKHKVELLQAAFGSRVKIHYAMKANYNLAVLSTLKDAGLDGLDTVAPYEILLGKKIGFAASDIMYTGNSTSNDEMAFVHNEGVLLNLGSISELRRYGEQFPNTECAVRLNVDVGAGECDFVVTGGEDTKFGISDKDIAEAMILIKKHGLKIVGVHSHIGSGFYEKESFLAGVQGILDRAKQFGNALKFVDLGGGFGIRYNLDKSPIDIMDWGNAAQPLLEVFAKNQPDDFHYKIEPGKFLVGESTCLLTTVTMIKPERKTTFVGTDTGFQHLIRPALYGSYHQIINLTAMDEDRLEQDNLTIVGNVCESGDIFAKNISMPQPQEGDVLAILCAGGYGQSMSSIYQLRSPAAEVMVNGNDFKVTKGKKSFDEILRFI